MEGNRALDAGNPDFRRCQNPIDSQLCGMGPRKRINLIVACDEQRVIGKAGKLPWHIPEDLAWLEEKTRDKVVILGRVCYETWPSVHLGNRQPFVLTRQPGYRHSPIRNEQAQSPRFFAELSQALSAADALAGDIFVCGGQKIFEESLPLADRLYLTLVEGKHPGDRWFPDWRHLCWKEVYRRQSTCLGERYQFLILDRDR